MTPQYGIVLHNPPEKYGDCLRACIATVLDLDVLAVPHFMRDGDDERGKIEMDEWLLSRGLRMFYTALIGETTSLSDIFAMMKSANKDIVYFLFCRCGDADHVVVCQNDQVLHDPSVYRTAVTGPTSQGLWVVAVLVPVTYYAMRPIE